MRKIIFLILVILLQNNKISGQNRSDCFELPIFLFSDSVTLNNLDQRNKDFYDGLINCNAPDFKVTTLDGDTIELKKCRGKIVVINFWFTKCPLCITEMPSLNKLVEEFKARGVVFVGMCRDSQEVIKSEFLGKHQFDFNIVSDCSKIADSYCVLVWPTTFVLDKTGKVKNVLMGEGRIDKNDKENVYDKVSKTINELLEE